MEKKKKTNNNSKRMGNIILVFLKNMFQFHFFKKQINKNKNDIKLLLNKVQMLKTIKTIKKKNVQQTVTYNQQSVENTYDDLLEYENDVWV